MKLIHPNRKQSFHFLPLIVLLVIASLEFMLLLRHKSAYMSDSYFYKHIFYEMQGDSFETARAKILLQLNKEKLGEIEQNLFFNLDKYQYSLSRYIRRPLYPFAAVLINLLAHNEYVAFLVPTFMGFFGCIWLTYLLFRLRFDWFWTSFGTALFVSFYPFLDWSTYFLTDTIGAGFWMLQIYLIIKYLQNPSRSLLILYLFAIIISMFNREQSVLMSATVLILFFSAKLFKAKAVEVKPIKNLVVPTIGITVLFLIFNTLMKYPSLYDSWIYLQSDFGFKTLEYTPMETAQFLGYELIELHLGLVSELVRHRWWLLFTILGFIGAYWVFLKEKKPRQIDLLMFASAIAAYLGLIIVPYLTYRYFFPTIISVVYFSLYALHSFFYKQRRLEIMT
ncbi:TPA: hypothetical protein DIV55_02280 [Patescibacteria group bacterium]|uniref:Glycosyltransferase RgtA/B/C/D-like domain-containing protein n=1 Tax=Candidatus Gottesmanbacteria bacterium GW2011_GWA1_43_11 TaxID=1618436 RepID=A0A0G1CEW7_9BACT|nr:MAG: hypothetical protein UV59_C0021G0016 [Candidatus Gottesmanbacteria bacterium GW2011_GWA1_43_11]HCS78549.1 hypothetical protein [Patescibacteria group bacterium]